MKILIDRSLWLRGMGTSSLWSNSAQQGCCLGHVISQVDGIPIESLAGLTSPSNYSEQISHINFLDLSWMIAIERYNNSQVCNELMVLNDNQNIKDDEREAALIAKFKTIGLEVEFFDGVPSK